MSIVELKFTESNFAGRDIASLPDRPGESGMTTAELKDRFDLIPKVLVALGVINKMIDALMASSGASDIGAIEIPGVSGNTVQTLLEGLKTYLDAGFPSKSELSSTAGAAKIGASSITGVSGGTVQTLLEGLKAYADNLAYETGALRLYTTATDPGSPGPYIWLQPADSSVGLLALGSSAGDGLNVTMDNQTLAVTNAEAGTGSGETLSYTIR